MGATAAPVQLPASEPIIVEVGFVGFIVFDVSLTVDFAIVFVSEIDMVSDNVLFSEYFSLSANVKTSAALVGSVSVTLWGLLPIHVGGIPIGSDICVNTGGDGVSEIPNQT